MTFVQTLYNFSIQILTFWLPISYAFKYLMDKQNKKITLILKFWSVICCYHLLAFLLECVIDQNIFPWINITLTAILCLPPYEIAQKAYDLSLGNIFRQNKESFMSVQETVIAIFDQNKQKITKKMQKQTGDKMKGLVGNFVLAATMNNQNNQNKSRQVSDSDSDSLKQD